MYYIEINSDNVVTLVHAKPFDPIYGFGKTQAELEQTGYLVDSIPSPDASQNNKIATLKFDPITKTFSYTYTDAPETQEQIVADLQSQNAQILLALVNGGLM